jgi:hypothetical protein
MANAGLFPGLFSLYDSFIDSNHDEMSGFFYSSFFMDILPSQLFSPADLFCDPLRENTGICEEPGTGFIS